MAWQDELVPLTRAIIDDLTSPFEFSDQRLTQVLVLGFFQVYQQTKGRLPRAYEINIPDSAISPDPSGTSLSDPDRDETLLNLTLLKTACIMQQGAARKAAGASFALKDGNLFVDTRGKASGLVELLKSGRSYCQDYDDALRSYLLDASGTAAAAVIGPFRISGASGATRRPDAYTGRKYFG